MTQKLQNERDRCISNLLRSSVFFPFGLDILNYDIVFTESTKLDFLACTDFNKIYINYKKLLDGKKENWLSFLLLHEILHIIFYHDKRKGVREHFVWQFATDFMINLFIYNLFNESKNNESQIVKIPFNEIKEECLFSEKFNNMLEEEIYEELIKKSNYKKTEQKMSFKSFMEEVTGKKDENDNENDKNQRNGDEVKITKHVINYDGKEYKHTEVELPKITLTKEQKEALDERISFSKSMIQNSLLSRGLESSKFQSFLKRIFNVKVDWKVLLADSILTELEKNPDMEWMSPRLSWLVNPQLPYLPNYSEIEKYGTVIFSIDESGSMSDDDVSKAIDIIQQSKEYYKNIYVIKHDVDIHTKLYDHLSSDDIKQLLERKHCGGTSHKKVFEEVVNFSKTAEVFVSLCVFITDMCSDIEETQHIISSSIPRVYLVPTQYQKPKNKTIIGKIIEVK